MNKVLWELVNGTNKFLALTCVCVVFTLNITAVTL